MRTVILTLASFLGFTLISSADAKTNPADDLPSLTNARHRTEENLVTVRCLPVYGPSRPHRAQCSISQFMFHPMSEETLKGKLEEIDAAARGKGPGFKKMFKETCEKVSKATPDPIQQDFLDQVAVACRDGDVTAFWEAFRKNLRDVDSHTCSVLLADPDEAEFEQIDANTWRVVTTSDGACSVVLIRTLWRKPGAFLWEYTQERSVSPSADSKCVGLAQKSEWSFRHGGIRPVPCKYIK